MLPPPPAMDPVVTGEMPNGSVPLPLPLRRVRVPLPPPVRDDEDEPMTSNFRSCDADFSSCLRAPLAARSDCWMRGVVWNELGLGGLAGGTGRFIVGDVRTEEVVWSERTEDPPADARAEERPVASRGGRGGAIGDG